jgi:hypothetical protein
MASLTSEDEDEDGYDLLAACAALSGGWHDTDDSNALAKRWLTRLRRKRVEPILLH